jgi:EAL domain-containing protein (putative c-di-GMP-specific phosphodiesterase class I)
VSGTTVRVSASIGIASAAQGGVNAAELLRQADVALYAAKRAGRRRSQLFTEDLAAQHHRRKLLETSLRDALAGAGGLRLAYQPKLELRGGRLVGFEALARWDHPQLGPVAPDVFVPIAEETGLIGALDRWVVGEAVRQIAAWEEGGMGADLSVAVNLSAAQLVHGDIVAATLEAIEAAGIAPSRLKVEVTESVLLRDVDRATLTLARFRAHGIGVAIDDFGTGFSSLSYLVRLPFDELKIDRSLVLAMGDSMAALAVVRSVIDLARSLGAVVVAEGIETREQLAALQELGCDQGQGYLLGRPGGPDRALDVVRRTDARFWGGGLAPAPARPAAGPEVLGAVALGA